MILDGSYASVREPRRYLATALEWFPTVQGNSNPVVIFPRAVYRRYVDKRSAVSGLWKYKWLDRGPRKTRLITFN